MSKTKIVLEIVFGDVVQSKSCLFIQIVRNYYLVKLIKNLNFVSLNFVTQDLIQLHNLKQYHVSISSKFYSKLLLP